MLGLSLGLEDLPYAYIPKRRISTIKGLIKKARNLRAVPNYAKGYWASFAFVNSKLCVLLVPPYTGPFKSNLLGFIPWEGRVKISLGEGPSARHYVVCDVVCANRLVEAVASLGESCSFQGYVDGWLSIVSNPDSFVWVNSTEMRRRIKSSRKSLDLYFGELEKFQSLIQETQYLLGRYPKSSEKYNLSKFTGVEVVRESPYSLIVRFLPTFSYGADGNRILVPPILVSFYLNGSVEFFPESSYFSHPHGRCLGDYSRPFRLATRLGDVEGVLTILEAWRYTHGSNLPAVSEETCVYCGFKWLNRDAPNPLRVETPEGIKEIDITWLKEVSNDSSD